MNSPDRGTDKTALIVFIHNIVLPIQGWDDPKLIGHAAGVLRQTGRPVTPQFSIALSGKRLIFHSCCRKEYAISGLGAGDPDPQDTLFPDNFPQEEIRFTQLFNLFAGWHTPRAAIGGICGVICQFKHTLAIGDRTICIVRIVFGKRPRIAPLIKLIILQDKGVVFRRRFPQAKK